jgi:ATP-dependent Clp protease ATP-binding subunit ClpB
VGDDVKEWLCQRGYDPRYGARPLNRLIAREIGNRLADEIIRGRLRMGGVASVVKSKEGEGLEVLVEEPGGRNGNGGGE